LISVMFFLSISLLLTFGFSALALQEKETTRLVLRAKQSYFLAESGIEDATYRIMNGKAIDASESLTLNNSTVTTSITDNFGEKDIVATGDINQSIRIVSTTLETSAGALFNHAAQIGYLGLTFKNDSSVIGSVFSNGNVYRDSGGLNNIVTGDVFVAKGIGTLPDQENTLGFSETSTIDPPREFFVHEVDGLQDAAQQFIPTVTAEPLRLDFYVKKVGNVPNLNIRIVPDDGSGAPLHNNTIASGQLKEDAISDSNFSWVSMTFNSTDILTAGIPYWIIINSTGFNGSKYWIFGGDDDTSYADGTYYTTQDWNQVSAVWIPPASGIADIAFKLYLAEVDTYIDSIQIGTVAEPTDAHALHIGNSIIHGDAYCNINDGGNTFGGDSCPCADPPTCSVSNDFDDVLPIDAPLSDPQIQQFKDNADLGGTCDFSSCPQFTGSFTVNSSNTFIMDGSDVAASTGPVNIVGDMLIKNSSILTLGGDIHVSGKLDIEGSCTIKLDPSYGSATGIIVVDGKITVKNNCIVDGVPSDPDSYTMLLSTDPDTNDAITIEGNGTDVGIVYASKGSAFIKNNPIIRTLYGNGVRLEGGAVLQYESGLASLNFSGGPTSGFAVKTWREVE